MIDTEYYFVWFDMQAALLRLLLQSQYNQSELPGRTAKCRRQGT